MTSPLLSVRAVKAYYGHIAALKGVDSTSERARSWP